jgi:hypothetical protein
LEQKWGLKKVKLHQKLALRLFQDDVKQVLDWLENHGEVFLRKNVGIGRNLVKAKSYQRSHQHFECVAQVISTMELLLHLPTVSITFFESFRTLLQMLKNCWLQRKNWLRLGNVVPMKYMPLLDN